MMTGWSHCSQKTPRHLTNLITLLVPQTDGKHTHIQHAHTHTACTHTHIHTYISKQTHTHTQALSKPHTQYGDGCWKSHSARASSSL